ncbi:MAG: DUF1624 domain-containing protein [Bacteroidales bacterium]|nr:DUF1624 domain-containing protein [Bacteroidales bacterium]
MKNTRNRTADILKGVAVLLMVQVHLIELFAQQQIFDSNIGSVLLFLGGPPAAPIFMAVMGYFIALGNSNISISIMRGIKLIVGGLILNVGLNLHLYYKIYNNTIETSPLPYLFGVDILFLAGLSIITLSLFNILFKKRTIPYVLAIIFIFVIGKFVSFPENSGAISYFTAFIYSDSWWSYFPFLPWLAYPLTGYVFYLILPSISRITENQTYKILILIISAIILIGSIGYGISIAANLHVYYHHNFLYYLFTLNFMIFWTILFNFITSFPSNIITNFLEWMGKNVTIFYVVQWLIIGNIATALYKTQNGIELLLWFIGIFTLTSLLTFLLVKVKNAH